MAYLNSSYLADSEDFRRRVEIALLNAVKDVMAENPTITNHGERVVYAKKVISDPTNETLKAIKLVITNTSISSSSSLDKNLGRYTTTATDSDIQFTVNSLFNALAGIST